MKVAIFTRVSSTNSRQENDRQVNGLKNLCDQNNWEVVAIIKEKGSGGKRVKDRPELWELLQLAENSSIQKVVISEISRLGRKVKEGIKVIEQLASLKVSIYIENIGMETLLPNGKENILFKPILITLMGFAEMERELTRERILSGLEEAKRKGKKLGRPKGSVSNKDHLLKKHKKVVRELKVGTSIRKTAKICGVSSFTVQKIKALI